MQRMTVRDIDEERFFKIPKVLNEDDYYKCLPVVARYLYGVMLDRFKLSKSRNWINSNGEVYFIFKQKDLAELLNVSLSSIKRSVLQLIDHSLIESEATIKLTPREFKYAPRRVQIELIIVRLILMILKRIILSIYIIHRMTSVLFLKL